MESSTLDVQRALLARTQVQIMAADCLHRFCTEKNLTFQKPLEWEKKIV